MANVLKLAMQNAIAILLGRGRSQRDIARELGLSRNTVGRYARAIRLVEPNEAIPTAGSDCGGEGAKGAIATAGSAGRRSDCEPFRETIEEKVALGLSAQRIWQDLQGASDSAPGYESVKRFVRQFGDRMEPPCRRMESPPGREAQVDFGKGAPVVGEDGKRTRPHLFRIVLSHSRAGYSEVVRKQDAETFIRCIENAFLHFGGVTETLVVDNLKAAVTKADWYDPDIHPKLREFCLHYGTVVLPTKPRMPRHKGYLAYCTSSVA